MHLTTLSDTVISHPPIGFCMPIEPENIDIIMTFLVAPLWAQHNIIMNEAAQEFSHIEPSVLPHPCCSAGPPSVSPSTSAGMPCAPVFPLGESGLRIPLEASLRVAYRYKRPLGIHFGGAPAMMRE